MAGKRRPHPDEQFHQWFDVLPEPVLLLSGDGTVLAANKSLGRLVGPRQIVGASLAEFASGPPDCLDSYINACAASREAIDGSLILADADGNLVSCRCQGADVELDCEPVGGRVLLRLFPATKSGRAKAASSAQESAASDATLLESQLRRSEERLRLALEAGQMAIWEWQVASNEMVASPGLQGMRGRGYGYFRGSLDEYEQDIHAQDRVEVVRSIEESLASGKKYSVEYRLIGPDGNVRWVEDRGSPVYDEAGRPTGIVCITISVDKRKQLEQDLQNRLDRLTRTEAQVRSVIDTAVDGIITISEKGAILNVNPAAERIFGYEAAEILDKNISLLMPEPYRSQHDRYIANYLRTGQTKIMGTQREMAGLRKDGSVFPMELGVSECRLDGRRYFTGIGRDITERKRAENVSHFMADASRSLAAAVDYVSTLRQVAYLAVPFFADWCTVHIGHEDGSLRQLAAAHIDPEKSEVMQELANGCALSLTSAVGPARVFASGKSELLEDIPDALIESVAEEERHRQLLRNLGLVSYVGVPLSVRGKVLGVMLFFSADANRKYDLTDLAVAEDLGAPDFGCGGERLAVRRVAPRPRACLH